jgi:hypothetical protein
MKKWHFALLCVLCVAQASVAQKQERTDVAFVDKTPEGSPLEVAGQVSLQENIAGNQVEAVWGEKIVAKNTSTKPILLFVVSLSLLGRHSRGALRGPGDGPTYNLSDDRFFTEDVIKPGDTVVLRDSKPDAGKAECCINPLERGSDPKAEFRVRFVQFADGSSFGDPSEAKNDLEVRAMILNGLRKVVQSYSENGERGFLAAMEHQPWSNTLPCANIWTIYTERGVNPAMVRAQQTLTTAEKHVASTRPGPRSTSR